MSHYSELFAEFKRALDKARLGGKTASITPTITTTDVAYTSGDNVGGVLKLDSAVTTMNGTAILKSIVVKDSLNQKSDLTILLFNTDPTQLATATDNSAFAWGSSFPFCIGSFNVAAADYDTIDSKAIATIDVMSSPLQNANGTINLWAVVITTGTPTYGANATTLYITFNLLQD